MKLFKVGNTVYNLDLLVFYEPSSATNGSATLRFMGSEDIPLRAAEAKQFEDVLKEIMDQKPPTGS